MEFSHAQHSCPSRPHYGDKKEILAEGLKIGGSQEILKILIVLVFAKDSDTGRKDSGVIEYEAGHL